MLVKYLYQVVCFNGNIALKCEGDHYVDGHDCLVVVCVHVNLGGVCG